MAVNKNIKEALKSINFSVPHPTKKNKSWEYNRVLSNSLDLLNSLGKEGWKVIIKEEGGWILLKREIDLPMLDQV